MGVCNDDCVNIIRDIQNKCINTLHDIIQYRKQLSKSYEENYHIIQSSIKNIILILKPFNTTLTIQTLPPLLEFCMFINFSDVENRNFEDMRACRTYFKLQYSKSILIDDYQSE